MNRNLSRAGSANGGYVHGGVGTAEHRAWKKIKERCFNPRCKDYPGYGGRGITVCERWRNSFAAFLADMGPRPSLAHSIDRYPDGNGNYEPGNCRWATATQQARNTRRNVVIEFNGRSASLAEWAESLGLNQSTLRLRLKSGQSLERALVSGKQRTGVQAQRGIDAARRERGIK